MKNTFKISVLDQSPVRKGVTAKQAVEETVELSRLADHLGFTRFWVSEHHNTTTLAGSTPEVLIAHLANHTSRIRIGSGGIMLPNHSALKVAENFKMLEIIAPGRIDLGIGRAPGTDRLTAGELNPSNSFSEQELITKLYDLRNYLYNTPDPDTVQSKIIAIPMAETVPPIWLLSSSGQSGLFAAHFGMGMSFAHFINPIGGPEYVKMYRDRFQPSTDLDKPVANVCAFVFCSEDEEVLHQQQAVMDHRFLQLEKGGKLEPINYADIKDVSYNSAEKERIQHNRLRMITGTPKTLKPKLDALMANYDCDELMAVTITENFNDRLQSYQLLAEMSL